MIRLIIIIALMLAANAAFAQLLTGVSRTATGGGSPIAPSCSNSMDFSQACNSQYIGAI
jgi:hypothetical protein